MDSSSRVRLLVVPKVIICCLSAGINGLGGAKLLISVADFSLKKTNHIPVANPRINKKAPAAKKIFLFDINGADRVADLGCFAASAAISRADKFFLLTYSEISPFRV